MCEENIQTYLRNYLPLHPTSMDISGRRSAGGGEILLPTPGCTFLIIILRVVGRFSYSPQAGHLRSSFGVWWGDSLTRPRLHTSGCRSVARWGDSLTRPRLDTSGCRSARGGEILTRPRVDTSGHLSISSNSEKRQHTKTRISVSREPVDVAMSCSIKRHFYLMLTWADLAYPTYTKMGAARSLVQMSGNTSVGREQVKVNTDTRQTVQASRQ